MFNSITWGQYITATTVLSLCYYLYIGFKYYRWEILGLIGIRKVEDVAIPLPTVAHLKSSLANESHENYLPKPSLEIDVSPLVQLFTDEVNACLQEAANNKVQKSELLNCLQIIASKYPALKDADCKDELLQLVLVDANKYYPNLLGKKDIEQLWN